MTTYQDKKRFVIEIDQQNGDELCAAVVGESIHIEIDEPWAGDTFSGFGATCSAYLTPKEAVELGFWLLGAAIEANGGIIWE